MPGPTPESLNKGYVLVEMDDTFDAGDEEGGAELLSTFFGPEGVELRTARTHGSVPKDCGHF